MNSTYYQRNKLLLQLIGLLGAFSLAGCGNHPEFVENRLLLKRLEIELGEELSSTERSDVQQAITELFGSSDQPALVDGVEVVSLDYLKQSAGRVYSDEQDTHFGLYRKHCIRCHGTSGDGRGPAARLLSPYPRDFRFGKFKFKTTPQGSKPTKEDLVKILRSGIPGTSMPSFALLRDEDIDALVDYVIYLSVRGESERSMLFQVAHTLDYARGDRLIDFELKSKQSKEFEQQLKKLQESVQQVYSSWKLSPTEQPVLPSSIPVLGASTIDASNQTALTDSIVRGQQLFQNSIASCSKCHAADGSGQGAPKDYDAWTKDWTTSINVTPDDKAAMKPLLKAGGLKPESMKPRDLRKGVFRGGSAPQDIFARIVNGIEGTSMPAAALQKNVPDGMTSDQIWDLVNFVLSLSQQPDGGSENATSAPTADVQGGTQ
ncbi:MAG: cytochrome c [Pirellulales bacterium]